MLAVLLFRNVNFIIRFQTSMKFQHRNIQNVIFHDKKCAVSIINQCDIISEDKYLITFL